MITGIEPPLTPIEAKAYTDNGLPWFDLYDESAGDVSLSEHLAQVKTIAERDAERGETTRGNASFDVSESQIRTLRRDDSRAAHDKSPSPDTTGYA